MATKARTFPIEAVMSALLGAATAFALFAMPAPLLTGMVGSDPAANPVGPALRLTVVLLGSGAVAALARALFAVIERVPTRTVRPLRRSRRPLRAPGRTRRPIFVDDEVGAASSAAHPGADHRLVMPFAGPPAVRPAPAGDEADMLLLTELAPDAEESDPLAAAAGRAATAPRHDPLPAFRSSPAVRPTPRPDRVDGDALREALADLQRIVGRG